VKISENFSKSFIGHLESLSKAVDFGRVREIRTPGLCFPKAACYLAAPLPVNEKIVDHTTR
jgi:hypothetical protein